MTSDADVSAEQQGRVTVARMTGELDLSNIQALEVQLWRAIPNAALAVVVDLSDVRYLDSAGLNLMFRLKKNLSQRGQRLALVVPEQAMIWPLLRLVQLERSIAIHPTIQDALSGTTAPAE